jgi:hypothetical protein
VAHKNSHEAVNRSADPAAGHIPSRTRRSSLVGPCRCGASARAGTARPPPLPTTRATASPEILNQFMIGSPLDYQLRPLSAGERLAQLGLQTNLGEHRRHQRPSRQIPLSPLPLCLRAPTSPGTARITDLSRALVARNDLTAMRHRSQGGASSLGAGATGWRSGGDRGGVGIQRRGERRRSIRAVSTTRDEVVRHPLVEQVAHVVDEDAARLAPLSGRTGRSGCSRMVVNGPRPKRAVNRSA